LRPSIGASGLGIGDKMIEICEDGVYWDELVERSPHGSIFHTWEWLKIVEKHTSSKLYPIVGFKGSTPIGVYPIFLQKRGIFRLAFSPPSRALLLYMGPAFVRYNSLKQSRRETTFLEFQNAVDKFIRDELRCGYVRVRTSPELIDCRPLKWSGYDVEPLYTYVIDLAKGVDGVLRNLNRKLRAGIEKTRKEGVKVEQGDKEDLEHLRILLYERFVKQGRKPKRSYYKSYLRDIYRRFYPDNLRIFVARYKGETVGGLVVLCFKDWSALWIGIPKIELKGIYPNDLAQWEAIKWACENGFKRYEEMDAGHLKFRHFKSKYNPCVAPWFSAEKCLGMYRFAKVIRGVLNVIKG